MAKLLQEPISRPNRAMKLLGTPRPGMAVAGTAGSYKRRRRRLESRGHGPPRPREHRMSIKSDRWIRRMSEQPGGMI
jgi:hypothetical protein